MNGAQALIRTLVDAGVDVCFTNPGTSEMHFVAALDDVPEMRGVLALFEGVATGAADGYGRMAGKPAATLLHLGPGPRQRARQPAQRPPGAHADRQHRRRPRHLPQAVRRAARVRHRDRRPQRVGLDAPLARRPTTSAADAADAVAAAVRARPGQVATLILPADVSWSERGGPAAPGRRRRPAAAVDADVVDDVATALRSGEPCARCSSAGARAAASGAASPPARVASATGRQAARPRPSPPASSAAPGCPPSTASAYLAEFAPGAARRRPPPGAGRHQVAPVSFFAYPGKASDLVPEGCEVHVLAAGAATTRSAPLERAGRRARRAAPTRRRSARRPARPADRRAHARDARRRRRRPAARGRDRRRRGQHRRACSPPAPPPGAPPHDWLDPHRRRHRPRPARGHRRGGRLPRPPGAQPRGRRQRDVHAAGAVDPGPRGARRHHRHLQQPLATRSSTWSWTGSAPRPGGPKAPGHARPAPTPTSTSSRWRRASASPATRATTAEELTAQLERGARRARPAPHRGHRSPARL